MATKYNNDPDTSLQAILDQLSEYVTDRIHIFPKLTRHLVADLLQSLSTQRPTPQKALPLKQLIHIAKLCSQLHEHDIKAGVLKDVLMEQLERFVSTNPQASGAIVKPEAAYLMEFQEFLATSGPGGDVTYLIAPLIAAQRSNIEEEVRLAEQKRRDESWKDRLHKPVEIWESGREKWEHRSTLKEFLTQTNFLPFWCRKWYWDKRYWWYYE